MILSSMDLAYDAAFQNEVDTLTDEGWKNVDSDIAQNVARKGVCQNHEIYAEQYHLAPIDFLRFAAIKAGLSSAAPFLRP